MHGFSVSEKNTVSQNLAAGLLIAASFLPRFGLAAENQETSTTDGRSVAANTEDAARASLVKAIAQSETFKALPNQDQKLTIMVYDALPAEGQPYLLMLLDRTVRGTNQSALFDRDFFGGRCIDNIAAFTAEQWHPAFAELRSQILVSYLCELACPGELNQSEFAVCGTSLFYNFYLHHPGEASRVVRGLFSPEGRVELLKPGAYLERAPYSLAPDSHGNRTMTEAMMMSAFMELANGPDKHYCKICDMHYDKDTGKVSWALTWNQTLAIYRAIYNIPTSDGFNAPMRSDKSLMDYYFKTYLPGNLSASLRWSETSGNVISYESIHHTDTVEGVGVAHFSDYRTQFVKGPGYHRVDVLSVANGRVYFRNPQGTTWPDGTELTNPPCRVENQRLGIQSMTRAEFENRLDSFLIPQRDQRYPTPIPRAR